MMYEVMMDGETPGWSLGQLECESEAIDCRVFTYGLPQTPSGPLSVRVKRQGEPEDCTFSAFFVPIVTRRFGDVFERIAPDSIQRFPVKIREVAGEYEVLNIIRVVDAVDRERSKYLLWKPEDERPDKLGKFRDFDRLVLKRELPTDLHTFRIAGWEIVWVVSPALKAALEEAGCRGALFLPIEQ